jgi:hypothetical protein
MIKKSTRVLTTTEPWWGRTQKITAAILGVLALLGVIWSTASKADARYAKDKAVAAELKSVKTDIAMLGKAFQYDQFSRAIEYKQDTILKIELRLKEKISVTERAQLEVTKRKLEFEIEDLKAKQQKLN